MGGSLTVHTQHSVLPSTHPILQRKRAPTMMGKKASFQLPEDRSVRRSYLSKELVTEPAEGIETVADVLPYCVGDPESPHAVQADVSPARPAHTATRPHPTPAPSSMSSRRRSKYPRRAERTARPRRRCGSSTRRVALSAARADGLWLSFTLSKPAPVTYNEMYASVKDVSSGLRALGLGKSSTGGDQPDADEDGRERAGVYAETRWGLMSAGRWGGPSADVVHAQLELADYEPQWVDLRS